MDVQTDFIVLHKVPAVARLTLEAPESFQDAHYLALLWAFALGIFMLHYKHKYALEVVGEPHASTAVFRPLLPGCLLVRDICPRWVQVQSLMIVPVEAGGWRQTSPLLLRLSF